MDELRLMVFPVTLSSGRRLFGETSDKKRWRLVGTQTVGDGVLILTYEPVRNSALRWPSGTAILNGGFAESQVSGAIDRFWPGSASLASRFQTFSTKSPETSVKSLVDPEPPVAPLGS